MKKSIVVLLSMLLLACSNTEHEDLRQWMSETSKETLIYSTLR